MQLITRKVDIEKKYKIALFSDLHIDSMDCNREKLKADLTAAHKDCDEIIINGDLFSCILPTDRKRFVRSQSMFDSDAQLNEIVKYVADFLNPFKDKISIIGLGNHETSVMKFNNYNPIQGVIDRLDCGIEMGGFKDYIRFVCRRPGQKDKGSAFDILKFHGAGGSAPVTKGMIDLSRLSGTYVADLIWIGHKHTALVNNSGSSVYVSQQNNIKIKNTISMITPGYHKPVEQKDHYDLSYSEERFNGISAANGYGVVELWHHNHELQKKAWIEQ